MPALGDSAQASVTHVRDPDGLDVIAISGELDLSNVNIVRRELDLAVGESSRPLVFELSHLGFIDSSGIALLVQVATRVEHVSIRNASPLIRRVLETTGVAAVLPMKP